MPAAIFYGVSFGAEKSHLSHTISQALQNFLPPKQADMDAGILKKATIMSGSCFILSLSGSSSLASNAICLTGAMVMQMIIKEGYAQTEIFVQRLQNERNEHTYRKEV